MATRRRCRGRAMKFQAGDHVIYIGGMNRYHGLSGRINYTYTEYGRIWYNISIHDTGVTTEVLEENLEPQEQEGDAEEEL